MDISVPVAVIYYSWNLWVMSLLSKTACKRPKLFSYASRPSRGGRQHFGDMAIEIEGHVGDEAHFPVGHEGAARVAACGGAQVDKDVPGDAVVPLARLGHGVGLPVHQFVLDAGGVFETQVSGSLKGAWV